MRLQEQSPAHSLEKSRPIEMNSHPAIAPDGSDMAKPRATIGGNRLPALPGKDAGENN
jgi:hypothetical protein